MGEDRLYESIGGAPAIDVAVTIFYDRVLADPAVAPWFDGVDLPRLRQHQRDFLAIVLGGPTHVGTTERYRGRGLAVAHAGRAIDDDAFTRVRDHLLATLRELGVAPSQLTEVGGRVEQYRRQVVQDPA